MIPVPAPTTHDRTLRRAHTRLAVAVLLVLAGGSGAAFPSPGAPDPSFGTDGVVFIDSTVRHDAVRALLPLPDGSVLAAGTLDNGIPSSSDLAVVRLTPEGDLDLAFGNNGAALADTGSDGDHGHALLRQPDGRIVVAGALESGAYLDHGIARFLADGSPDTSFGEPDGGARRGFARVNLGPDTAVNDHAVAVAGQSDGKLVLAGVALAEDGNFRYQRFGLVRFLADGTVDTSFGSNGNGIVIAPATAAGVAEYATAIALRADGSLPPDNKITVVGYAFARSQALVRRFHADGSPDTSFDGDGTLVIQEAPSGTTGTGMTRIDAAVLQPDGKLLLAGTGRERGFTIMRLLANGSRDSGFGSNGRVTVKFSQSTDYDAAFALALQANGKIVAAGYATGDAADFAVVRLLPDGTPDAGFGDGAGRAGFALVAADDVANAVAILPRGEIVVAGVAQRPGPTSLHDDMAFLRLQGDSGIFSDGFED